MTTRSISVIFLLLFLSGCEKPVAHKSMSIGFNVGIESKGEIITTDNIGQKYGRFVTDVWMVDDADVRSEAAAHGETDPHYIKSSIVTYNPGGTPRHMWNMDQEKNWLNEVYLCFWSWAPVEVLDTDGATPLRNLLKSVDVAEGTLPFNYQLPTSTGDGHDAEHQQDLLFAFNYQKYEDDPEGLVDVHFYHALSWIRFMVDKTDGSFNPDLEIANISIKNIYKSGDCVFKPTTLGFAENKFAWSNLINQDSYSQNLTLAEDFTEPHPTRTDARLSTRSKAFMLIPQTTPEDALISITFKRSDNSTVVRSVSFKGEEWKAGLYYTYKISATSLNEPITVTVSYVDWIDGGTGRI